MGLEYFSSSGIADIAFAEARKLGEEIRERTFADKVREAEFLNSDQRAEILEAASNRPAKKSVVSSAPGPSDKELSSVVPSQVGFEGVAPIVLPLSRLMPRSLRSALQRFRGVH